MTSGFGVAVGCLFWAAIMFYSPRYFRVSGTPYATLALYAVGTLALMTAVAGLGIELSAPKFGNYFAVFLSEGPSSIPWAGPSGLVWENAGIAGAFLVGMGFFHVAAELLGRWRILEILFKMAVLLFAALAAMFLAGVVDELILKPLFLVPADRLTSGEPVPADNSGLPRSNEPNDNSEGLFGNAINAVLAVGTLGSAISGLVAGWAFVILRVRTILSLLRQ